MTGKNSRNSVSWAKSTAPSIKLTSKISLVANPMMNKTHFKKKAVTPRNMEFIEATRYSPVLRPKKQKPIWLEMLLKN